MNMTLKRERSFPNTYSDELPQYVTDMGIELVPGKPKLTVPAGTYEVERIDNPCRHKGKWLVIKGTLVGAPEGYLRDWENGMIASNPEHPNYGKPIDWKEFEIIITGG